jgi:hypothetical protein
MSITIIKDILLIIKTFLSLDHLLKVRNWATITILIILILEQQMNNSEFLLTNSNDSWLYKYI